MRRGNVVREKSYAFALRIIGLYKHLATERKEFVLSKQLLRSGTSVGANVREAINAENTADFIHKLAIAQKECDETCYWIELLRDSDYISESVFQTIRTDANELLKIIRSIILSTKNNS
jgi:four helix bundle protein